MASLNTYSAPGPLYGVDELSCMPVKSAGIVTRTQLVAARRYVIVAITALAAVITPPDVISQLSLAIPLVILFEGTLILMRFVERADAKERAAREAAETASGGGGGQPAALRLGAIISPLDVMRE